MACLCDSWVNKRSNFFTSWLMPEGLGRRASLGGGYPHGRRKERKGVPMPTLGSITKTIRINPRDLEIIEGLMEDGTSWSGAIHKLCEGVPSIKTQEVEIPKYVSEMETIGRAYGLSGEEIINKLISAMEEGLITYENGTFRAYSEEEYDMSRFKEACMDKGVPIQKMLDKAAQMVWSS